MPIFHGETEELLKALPTPFHIRLARKSFCRLLSKGVDVRSGKRLVEVSSDGKIAKASFEDGTTETGDLLIGCEGAHSVVREYLLGPEKATLTPVHMVASFAMAQLPVEAAKTFRSFAHRVMINFSPANYCLWIGCECQVHESFVWQQTYNIAQCMMPTAMQSLVNGNSC